MIEAAVLQRHGHRRVRISGMNERPNFRADGATHPLLEIGVVEPAGIRRADSPPGVAHEIPVFPERIPAVGQPRLSQIVGGDGRPLFLQHRQPEQLDVQIVIGDVLVQHLAHGDVQLLLDALAAGASRAPQALAEPAAVYLVEILIVGHRRPAPDGCGGRSHTSVHNPIPAISLYGSRANQ